MQPTKTKTKTTKTAKEHYLPVLTTTRERTERVLPAFSGLSEETALISLPENVELTFAVSISLSRKAVSSSNFKTRFCVMYSIRDCGINIHEASQGLGMIAASKKLRRNC